MVFRPVRTTPWQVRLSPVAQKAWRWLFYGGLVVILAGVLVFGSPPLPGAGVFSRNSEGFLLALVITGWIEFARPRLASSRWQWQVTLAAAAGCAAVALLLLSFEVPTRLATLNESLFAVAVLLPFLQRQNLLTPRVAAVISLGILAVIVAGAGTTLVVMAAETLSVLALAFPGLWIVDRQILDGRAAGLTRLRLLWYAFLVVAPLAFSLLASAQLDGPIGDAAGYGVRTIEAFLCMLLVQIYFAVRGRLNR